jgi:hypothetical protein
MSLPFVSPGISGQKSDQKGCLYQCFHYFHNNSTIFEAFLACNIEKGMIFFKRDFWARGWSVVGIYGV